VGQWPWRVTTEEFMAAAEEVEELMEAVDGGNNGGSGSC